MGRRVGFCINPCGPGHRFGRLNLRQFIDLHHRRAVEDLFLPKSNDGSESPALVYNRLSLDLVKKVGHATILIDCDRVDRRRGGEGIESDD